MTKYKINKKEGRLYVCELKMLYNVPVYVQMKNENDEFISFTSNRAARNYIDNLEAAEKDA